MMYEAMYNNNTDQWEVYDWKNSRTDHVLGMHDEIQAKNNAVKLNNTRQARSWDAAEALREMFKPITDAFIALIRRIA